MSDDPIRDIKDRVMSLEGKIQGLQLKDAVAAVHRSNVENRLGSIEDTLKWLVRIIIGAMILAIVGFVIGGGLSGV